MHGEKPAMQHSKNTPSPKGVTMKATCRLLQTRVRRGGGGPLVAQQRSEHVCFFLGDKRQYLPSRLVMQGQQSIFFCMVRQRRFAVHSAPATHAALTVREWSQTQKGLGFRGLGFRGLRQVFFKGQVCSSKLSPEWHTCIHGKLLLHLYVLSMYACTCSDMLFTHTPRRTLSHFDTPTRSPVAPQANGKSSACTTCGWCSAAAPRRAACCSTDASTRSWWQTTRCCESWRAS